MKVEKSVEIAAIPEKVWPFLIEPEKVLQWYLPLKKFEYIGKKHCTEGASLYFEEKVAGRLMKLSCIVTECIENKRFAFKMTSGTMMKSYQESWYLEATKSGSRFTFIEQGELPYGFFSRIIEPLAQIMSGSMIKKMLAKIKSLAEA